MKISKATLPAGSLLQQHLPTYDYIDSFQGLITDHENRIQPSHVGKAFFTSSPKWVGALFVLRNKLVSLVGLKTPERSTNRQELLNRFTCQKGERLGLFTVFDTSEREVILGEDDKHLDFRISLFLDQTPGTEGVKTLTISTTVKFNNSLGRLYFLPVRPLHKQIVPAMLKEIIWELEKPAPTNAETTYPN
ncbi:DUF2867 domain-containing protein [Telluribacter humicola]|uniref:DUF2867 domain-containing protein n=1 Tax=Telluribacter humicola TaxID=1720261 RepID=UPI001A95BA8E|nr:DUF2867 domain-containing protein [Telluribacter humicola]